MIGKLAQLFGIQRPAQTTTGPLALDQAAAALAGGSGSVSEIARRLAPAELPPVLAKLPPGSGAAVELAAAVLGQRSAGPELLRAVAANLSPVQRETLLAKVPDALRPSLLANGFDPLAGIDDGWGPTSATSAPDRARVSAGGDKIPPHLTALSAEIDLPARIADVRAGRSALSIAEKADVRESLIVLDQAQLKSLRELLVERPPHPQLRQMRDHPALKGPPTAKGILAILSGEPLGLSPKASPELVDRARQALAEFPHGFSPDVEAKWIDVLSQSPMAIRLVRNHGPMGLEAVRALGVANLEAAGHPWAEGQTLMRVGAMVPGKLAEVRAFADRHGPDALGDALRALGVASQGSAIVDRVAAKDGFEAAVKLAHAASADAHGLRCLRHKLGSDDAVLGALRGKSTAAISRLLADAGARIAEFGDGGVALELGAKWPKPQVRTPQIQRAETAVLAKLGLPADALAAGKTKLDEVQMGALSRALQEEIARRSPEQAELLERELLGRRFVAPRFYDALYDAGVKNPEHRYSVETFESWRAADSMVQSLAAESRGRPLGPGELTKVMQAAHRLAGAGMVGHLEQSHLKSEDLGRLRSRPEDHVQLGNMFQQVDRATAELLDRNPYLTPSIVRLDGAPTQSRPIVFAPGVDVPRMVADLDQFVRANERKLSPSELAAEVHFRLVSIHPFMDGNGRTAKLMADFVLARAGVEPPVWRKGDVLKNVETWPAAVREGVAFQLDVVKRHFDAVAAVGPRAPQAEAR